MDTRWNTFYGKSAPGGGGGARERGGDGDPGSARQGPFSLPHGGLGGGPRGELHLVPLVPGSGGGGGSAVISYRASDGTFFVVQGGGGGGGGGAVHLAARGSLDLSGGKILANGGSGGDGVRSGFGSSVSGPGGGGSGGSILLQATGGILLDCSSLEALGGLPGSAAPKEQKAGAGAGSPGWIRLEAGKEPLPDCGARPDVSTARLLLDAERSAAVSLPFRPGLGPGRAVLAHDLELGPARLLFKDQPPGTEAILLWEGGGESLDRFGGTGPLAGGVADPGGLLEKEWARFAVQILSNAAARQAPAIEAVRLSYRLKP
ncbi:MAG: hypothetical protein HY717_16935 [Planctomycetes bacterium]|nr:hypothetical protein [Planctomycetota bacterium]